MGAFDSIADYYEVFSDSEQRLEREGPLLTDLLRCAPGKRVVDLACGTGLHAAFLGSLGAEVTAFDLSPEMIAHARARRPHTSVRYGVRDMRELVGGPWDMAICLGNSLCLLPTPADVDRTFRAVYACLSHQGTFLVQVLNYAAPAARAPRHRVERKPREEATIVAVKHLVPHGDRTLLSITFHYLHGNEHTSATETGVLLNLMPDTLAAAGQRAGFELVGLYGGYDRSAYDPQKSPDVLCVFQRSEASVSAKNSHSMSNTRGRVHG